MSAYIDQKTERRTIPMAFNQGYTVGFDDGEYDLYAEAEWKIGWSAGQSDLKLMEAIINGDGVRKATLARRTQRRLGMRLLPETHLVSSL